MVLKKNRTPACGGESRMKNKQKRHTTSPTLTSTRHLLSHQNNNKQQPAFLPFNLPMECVSKARWGWWLQFRACVCVCARLCAVVHVHVHSFIHSFDRSIIQYRQPATNPVSFPSLQSPNSLSPCLQQPFL